MLGLGRGREAGGVGREKREGRRLVLSVLGKIEIDPPDEVPGGMTALEEFLQGDRGFSELNVEGRIHRPP